MNTKMKAQSWAWKRIVLVGMLLLSVHYLNAQKEMPIIRATSKKVDVKDGSILQKGVWNLSLEINPDVYFALPHTDEKSITFYTDIDSISFRVEPGKSYDFIILLNDTDTCFTKIESKRPELINTGELDPKLLQEDFSVLIKSLQNEHGDLFRYKNQVRLRALSDSLFQLLNKPMEPFEFSTLIGYMVAAIQDGHTGSKLPQELMNHYAKTVEMFPLQLWFIDDKAYTVCTNAEIPIETEILSIDGKSINEIKKRLFEYLPSDGTIESKKYWILNHVAFPFLFNWVYGEKSDYLVEYQTTEGQIRNMSLKADCLAKTKCFKPDLRNDKNLQLQFTSNDIAVLTISSFNSKELMRTNENYAQFLATSFQEIDERKVKKVILDLRNNAGGDDVYGALLYSYLTSESFHFHSAEQLEQPSQGSFKGEVYFLMNGLSFSTTSNMLAIAKSNERGIFIGEETGGGYYGCTSGETFRIVLPNSHIRIAIPKDASYNPVKPFEERGSGVTPDYRVIPSVSELLTGKDVQLNFALEMVGGK